MSRAILLGTPEAALPALRVLEPLVELAAVVTRPDRPRGRSGRPRPSPVKQAAQEHGLEILQPETAAELDAMVDALEPLDVGVVVAFGMLIPATTLRRPHRGFVNVHFSLLPRWRGAAPVERAILAGDETTGVSLILLDEGLDTGPVLSVEATPIGPEENRAELTDRLATLGAGMLADTLPGYLAGEIRSEPQPENGVTRARRITPEDRWLDPSLTSAEVLRRVRALAPRPGAYAITAGHRIQLLEARPADHPGIPPGEVRAEDGPVFLGTGDGAIQLAVVQPEGRSPMAASAWLRGVRRSPVVLESPPG
jgi:methionyl-tRNA formyltransferase